MRRERAECVMALPRQLQTEILMVFSSDVDSLFSAFKWRKNSFDSGAVFSCSSLVFYSDVN